MSRKHNPIVALVALILMILLVLACTGCEEAGAAEPTHRRFTSEYVLTHNKNGPNEGCHIITDTETGVQYLFYKDVNAGGLTVLQPAPAGEEAER